MKMKEPQTEGDLADFLKSQASPVRVVGGGTRGGMTEREVLSTAGLSGVTLYEPGALTLVAQAGTPVAEIDQVLAAENQRLAFEPMLHQGLLGTDGASTIGGVVAANVSGPRRVQAGACRDFLLGVRFVDGSGTLVKNGGRVMKNVTGYDLVKLLAGSWGTLGVLSEVSLKVLPDVETQTTVLINDLDARAAVAAMAAALGSPYEVTGAAYDPATRQVMLRLEGFESSVAYRAGKLGDVVGRFGAVTQDADSAARWRAIRDVAVFHDVPGDVWRISVKPSDAPDIADRIGSGATLFDWGGGLIWACVPEGTDLRRQLGGFDGHATLERGSAETQRELGKFQPQVAPIAAITERIRARFDPRGILNPGLMTSPAEG